MDAEIIGALPPAGWAAIFLLIAVGAGALFGLYRLLLKKDVRLKNMEIAQRQEISESKEEIVALASENAWQKEKDLVSSQYSTAVNLLQKLRIDIYEAGVAHLGLEDGDKRLILLDIAWVIEARLSRAVLLDLVRNHISGKSKEELARYADAKADGYWRRVKTDLFSFSTQLPGYNLASLMDHVPIAEFRKLFFDVYSSAIRIAGDNV